MIWCYGRHFKYQKNWIILSLIHGRKPTVLEQDYNKDKYPQLILTGSGLEAGISEEKAVAHVSSLLNYLADQSKFLKVLEYDSDFVADIRKYAEEIKQDGLHIYGFVMIGKKDEICALRDIPEVEYITTKLVQYE